MKGREGRESHRGDNTGVNTQVEFVRGKRNRVGKGRKGEVPQGREERGRATGEITQY